MIEHSSILNRLSMEQVLVSPERASWFDGNMHGLMSSAKITEIMEDQADNNDSDDGYWPEANSWQAMYRPYTVKNGVLQIPVFGVLLNRFAWQVGDYATGYQYIERAFARGMGDPEVKGIAFIHNSPGGEVAGNFELVDKIFARRGEKPMRAFARDHSYSASYSIASAADSIIMTRTGGVGSIGVVTAHMNWSKYMDNLGVAVTFIHAPEGGHKVDGNPYEALSSDAKARIQKRINKIYGIFVSTVSRNRAMSEDDVRSTKAGTFDSDEAIEVGLADSVGVFEESLEAFVTEVSDSGEEKMADTKTDMKNEDTVAKSAHDSAVAAARAEGLAEGAKAEKGRVVAILGCDAGKTRPKAALHCALKSDMTVEQASDFLSGLDEEKTQAAVVTTDDKDDKSKTKTSKNHFEEAMNTDDNPNVGGGGDDEEENDEGKASASLLSAYGAATGRKFGSKN